MNKDGAEQWTDSITKRKMMQLRNMMKSEKCERWWNVNDAWQDRKRRWHKRRQHNDGASGGSRKKMCVDVYHHSLTQLEYALKNLVNMSYK